MKIYFEEVFVLNFLLDFMILYGTKRILKISTCSFLSLILGSFIGGISTFLLFISCSPFLFLFIKIFISIVMVFCTFGKRQFGKCFFYFYLISILLGGFFYLLDIPNIPFVSHGLLLLLSFLFLFLFRKELLSYREFIFQKYPVKIYYQKKCYLMDGFLDTGNQLVSPYKKESILLIHKPISFHNVIYVPYQTIHNHGVIPCFRPDKVMVGDKEFSNCLIGIAKEKIRISGCECILPNSFKEELC